MNSRFRLLILFFVFAGLLSCVTSDEPDDHAQPKPPAAAAKLAIPPRAKNAMSGSAFAASISSSSEAKREDQIRNEFLKGNVPDYIRRPKAIKYRAQTRSGRSAEVIMWVLPDYLAIGSDQDFVRMPMSPLTAQEIADRYQMKLPTAKMVDIIYQAAYVKLEPRPFPPGRDMVTIRRYQQHNQVIQDHLRLKVPRELVAGHKKDIVLTNLLRKKPGRVAIYGWHRKSGKAIQPLTTVHGNWYADYSHGTRLILNVVQIDNKLYSLADILGSPEFAPLMSYEGPLLIQRYPIEQGVGRKTWWPQS